MVGLGEIVVPPPPPGISTHGLYQREERLRRLGLTLHRMQMRALTAERHSAVKRSYLSVPSTPTLDTTHEPVAPVKSSPERQERVQEYLRQRYARPVSCTPAEVRSHYAGVFGNDPSSESCRSHFNELGVPRQFPAFYGVCCKQSGITLVTQDPSPSELAPVEPSTSAHPARNDTATNTNHREFDFAVIRQRCNERIQARAERRLFTQRSS